MEAWEAHEAEDFKAANRLGGTALDDLIAAHGEEAGRQVSRLLSNAIFGRTEWDPYKCPRCDAEIIMRPKGATHPYEYGGTLSRTSREDDDAPIAICDRCGKREANRAMAANPETPEQWRTGTGIPGPEEWPLSIEELLKEDRAGLAISRSAEIVLMRPDDVETD